MRFLLAVLLPCSLFFSIGRPWAGLICLFLQITLFGWLPAAAWAVYALMHHINGQRMRRAVIRTS